MTGRIAKVASHQGSVRGSTTVSRAEASRPAYVGQE
jgi:hypothetical protein